MEGTTDELRAKFLSPENPSNSSKSREEGELSSSDTDADDDVNGPRRLNYIPEELPAPSTSQYNATTAAREEAVSVTSLNTSAEGVKEGVGCKVTRKSTSGVCVFLGNNLVVWSSRKQTVVARSVGEAEYQAIAQGVIEIMWLVSLFSELGFTSQPMPIIWSDNMAAKSIAENPVFHARTKHFEIDLHFIREKVEKGEVEIRYVPTSHQLADIFTKSLPKTRFQLLCANLGIRLSPASVGAHSKTSEEHSAANRKFVLGGNVGEAHSKTSEEQSAANRKFVLRGNVGDHET